MTFADRFNTRSDWLKAVLWIFSWEVCRSFCRSVEPDKSENPLRPTSTNFGYDRDHLPQLLAMPPNTLKTYLNQILKQNLMISTMIWGPPGIGKSSIVGQLAQANNLAFTDVRLSQLAPTDLRGLPVAENGISKWYPPEFLPRSGKGILFLDEINMAPPTMQGMAQQLILDRCVGSYSVPDGWFIWAAGNRKEDRASVFDMPAPLANRFLHLQVEADFESFKATPVKVSICTTVGY